MAGTNRRRDDPMTEPLIEPETSTHLAYLEPDGFDGLTPRYRVRIIERDSGICREGPDRYVGDIWAHHDESEIHPDLWGFLNAAGFALFASDPDTAMSICAHGVIDLSQHDPSETF